MPVIDDLIAAAHKADSNLQRFIADNRRRRTHDDSARNYYSGE
jgi:hypothetical protein